MTRVTVPTKEVGQKDVRASCTKNGHHTVRVNAKHPRNVMRRIIDYSGLSYDSENFYGHCESGYTEAFY